MEIITPMRIKIFILTAITLLALTGFIPRWIMLVYLIIGLIVGTVMLVGFHVMSSVLGDAQHEKILDDASGMTREEREQTGFSERKYALKVALFNTLFWPDLFTYVLAKKKEKHL